MDCLPEQLRNHEKKCRCCFSFLKPLQKTVNLSKSIGNRFYELTNIQLVMSQLYSNVICESCNSKLSEFSDFQRELIENQTTLYEHILVESSAVTSQEEDEENIKRETFVEFNENEQPNNATHFAIKKENPRFIIELKHESSQLSDSHRKTGNTETVTESDQNQWRCVICDDEFKSRSQLQIHKKSHKQPRELKPKGRKMCQICGISFASNGWYHHMLRAHTENFRFFCDFCGKGFRVKNDLKDHLNTHISIESRPKFDCTFCEASLLSKNALKNHFQTFHSEVIEEHPCDCGKIFSSRMKLVQHRLSVHSKENVNCSECEKSFSSKDTLRKHFNKHHKPKDPCNVCGKMFTPGMFMRDHMKLHDQPQFQCQVGECKKFFHKLSQLNYHKKVDHNPVDVTCDTCGASFSGSRNLSRHIARQHGNLKIECAVEGCKHTASRKDYLAAHYRSHKDIDEETRKFLLDKVKEIKIISW